MTDPKLVAAGNDGWIQKRSRLRSSVLSDRLHRGPEEDRDSGALAPWGRRPSRSDRCNRWDSCQDLEKGTLKESPGASHGLPNTHADEVNQDLLKFLGWWDRVLVSVIVCGMTAWLIALDDI
jgi:hypothetical protein